MHYPTISVVTPTLNSGAVLETELKSIRNQDYPQENIEIIIADGGSTDNTVEIAKIFNAKIVENSLKTGEAGKAAGLKHASGELIALIDSDNILPTTDWLQRMTEPFTSNPEIIASEPWAYTYRKEAGIIERYSSLTGVNDPLVLFFGNYDRLNTLTGKWTDIDLDQKDRDSWIEVTLEKNKEVPTIGANGTIFRREFLQSSVTGDYLFDIDILISELQQRGSLKVAKVKIGIIHTFCESSIAKFARKQKRRARDYYYYHQHTKTRTADWSTGGNKKLAIIRFSLYTLTILPPTIDAVRGYLKKPDLAWFFHPIACLITFWEYSTATLMSRFQRKEFDRNKWTQ